MVKGASQLPLEEVGIVLWCEKVVALVVCKLVETSQEEKPLEVVVVGICMDKVEKKLTLVGTLD